MSTQLTTGALPPLPHFVSDDIQMRFEAFHDRNPAVFSELLRRALALKRKGHTWYSIDALLHSLRVEMDLSDVEGGGGYRLNDQFTSRYSRLLMEREPELTGFFKTRQLSVEREA